VKEGRKEGRKEGGSTGWRSSRFKSTSLPVFFDKACALQGRKEGRKEGRKDGRKVRKKGRFVRKVRREGS
jgi:hypothetical protein